MAEPMTNRGQAFIAKWTDEGEYVFGRDMNDAIIAIEAVADGATLCARMGQPEAAMSREWPLSDLEPLSMDGCGAGGMRRRRTIDSE